MACYINKHHHNNQHNHATQEHKQQTYTRNLKETPGCSSQPGVRSMDERYQLQEIDDFTGIPEYWLRWIK